MPVVRVLAGQAVNVNVRIRVGRLGADVGCSGDALPEMAVQKGWECDRAATAKRLFLASCFHPIG